MAKAGTKNGTAKVLKGAGAAVEQPPNPPTQPEADARPPRLSGDDLIGGEGAIELDDNAAPDGSITTLPDEVAELQQPVEEKPPEELDGWKLVSRAIKNGVEALERHKPVPGGYLLWISRAYNTQMAGRGVGTDAIVFVPVPPKAK